MIKTRVTEILGIKYPIILAAMQWISRAELVAAASNAGGMGIIASLTFPTVAELREEIKKTKSLTDKPFAVNVTLIPTARPVNYEEYFIAAIEEGVKIVETSGRSPEPYMKLLKDAGVTVMHRATRTRDIRTAERVGVDIATIIGYEAAGLIGMEDTTALVRIPAAVDAVKIPVVAAGGIVDARGFVAALALGAEGVLIGTRFMLSKECYIHPKIKEWLLQVGEANTTLVQRSINNPNRVAKTDFAQMVLEMEGRKATLEELLPFISGLRQRDAYASGDFNSAVISVSQAIGLMHDIPSVKDIIEGIAAEARVIMRRLHSEGIDS